MNQTVKRWVAVEPRPQSVLGVASTGADGWARMRLNQTVKRWVAVEPRPQSVLGVVSTGADGWAVGGGWERISQAHLYGVLFNQAQGSSGRGRTGAGGFPKIPTRPRPPPTAVHAGFVGTVAVLWLGFIEGVA